MDQYTYDCNYCGAEYIPKRRHIQKYCSNSCRVNAFNQRKKEQLGLSKPENTEHFLKETNQADGMPEKDKMSWSGVGNAAAGTLAVNLATNFFTKEENKPATKGDIRKLLNGGIYKIIRIRNIPPRSDGSRAYFDTSHEILIYK
tara:strand:- start:3483 stop:3914 length:432 start_codon:yes stop_codon:yes gene_type:complete